MKKKLLIILSVLLMICLLFVGCGKAEENVGGNGDSFVESEIDNNDMGSEEMNTTTSPEIAETTAPVSTETTKPESKPITPTETTAPVGTETTKPEPKPITPADTTPKIGNVKNATKVSQDLDARSVSVSQLGSKQDAPHFTFYENTSPLTGSQWAITGKINTKTVAGKSGHILFVANKDSSNIANIFINRRVDGVNGIYQNITDGGTRTPASGNKNISKNLKDSTDWTAEFVFVYYKGKVELYLKEPGEDFELSTSIAVKWGTCAAEFTVAQYADVFLTELDTFTDTDKIEAVYNRLQGIPENPIDSKTVLFIGNSATSVNDIPQMLSRLSRKAGYNVTASSVILSGGSLTQHADSTTAHGQNVLNEIAKGYDIVFLQEVTSCISSDANRAATLSASKKLDTAIKESNAKTYFYVRPPTGKVLSGNDTYTQCLKYDDLFVGVANEIGATNVYVNRAFAYAVKNLNINLWGSDNAHTNEEGAYLITCVFFSTLFNKSATVLDNNGLSEDVARSLQQVADKVVFENYIPQ